MYHPSNVAAVSFPGPAPVQQKTIDALAFIVSIVSIQTLGGFDINKRRQLRTELRHCTHLLAKLGHLDFIYKHIL